jgi:uncharacterized protein YjbJ (UPF0337 family)
VLRNPGTHLAFSAAIEIKLRFDDAVQGEDRTMDKDEVKGKAKDVAGRIQRQAGEWTGSEENQAEGAAKQAEGKVQNAWGQIKDAGKKAAADVEAEAEAKRKERERKDENVA